MIKTLDLSENSLRFDGAIDNPPLWVPDSAEIINNPPKPVAAGQPFRIHAERRPAIQWDTIKGHHRKSSAGALAAFLNLAEGSANDVLDFTLQWGPVDANAFLRRHEQRQEQPNDAERMPPHYDLPPLSEWGIGWASAEELAAEQAEMLTKYSPADILTSGDFDVRAYEPLADWFLTARQFRALLLVAHGYQQGIEPENKTWGEALRMARPDEFDGQDVMSALIEKYSALGQPVAAVEYDLKSEERRMSIQVGRIVLGMEISRLLWLAQAHPVLTWTDSGPSLSLTGSTVSAPIDVELRTWEGVSYFLKRSYHDPAWNILDAMNCQDGSLFRALVLQLAASIKAGLYRCDNCQALFPLDGNPLPRKPRSDRSVYCSRWCSTQKHREKDRSSYSKRKSPDSSP